MQEMDFANFDEEVKSIFLDNPCLILSNLLENAQAIQEC